MKISFKWLSKYVDLKAFQENPNKLAELLTNGGLEVEGLTNQAQNFTNVVVGLILEKNKHPNADSLTLCLVEVGDKNPRRIVCGAKNHNQGDRVVVALPGAILPGNFEIKLSKIRGEESQGMLCSEKELGLSDESEGIKILPADAPIGAPFAQYANLDDIIMDVKVTPNRADCLSHFGMAREVAGLTGTKFEFPLSPFNEGRESTRKLIKLAVEDGERCPRYAGRAVINVKVGESPQWLKRSLESIGLRSINNVVDITNFVMMEVGQPLHAFDISKISQDQILVRGAKSGETFLALNDQELTLDGSELVIADGAQNILALAGVMGGKNSGVTDQTKNIFVESAYFLPSAVRRASRRHGLESDSSYRFSRGVDPDAVLLALNRACQLLSEITEGSVCTDSYDIYPRPLAKPRVELDLGFISARLGLVVEAVEVRRLLERIGCDVSGSGNKLTVNPPPFRADLRIAEDFAEEILRLKGFHNIPETIPQGSVAPSPDDMKYTLERKLGATMRALGVEQATNLSFLESGFQEKFLGEGRGNLREIGIDFNLPLVILENPINLELNSMRLSVIPSLMKNAAYNIRYGRKNGCLFEIASVFGTKDTPDIRDDVRPFYEETHLALVQWGEEEPNWFKTSASIPAFFKLKGILEEFFETWQFRSVKFEAMIEPPSFLHPGQSARIFVEGKPCGFIGILHPKASELLEIKNQISVVAELNLKTLFAGQPRQIKSKALPKFPSVERDVALLAPLDVSAGLIRETILKAGGPLVQSCFAFDVYVGDKLKPSEKSLAFRLTYQDSQKTLSDEEVNATHQKIITQVSQKLKVTLR